MLRSLLLSSLLLASIPARSADRVFTSGTVPVTVMELYTSEGCSSCPAAEDLLARLRDDPRLWRELVPVAFHVTYFDRPDWKDRFAKRSFTERQRALVHAWSSDRLYTPCLVRNGMEWGATDAPGPAEGPGTLTVRHQDNGRVQVAFQPVARNADIHFAACVVLLGGGLVSAIHGGENAGRQLTHEFVALSLQQKGLTVDASGAFVADFDAVGTNVAPTPRRALAVWVTHRGELTPLQATGGWLD